VPAAATEWLRGARGVARLDLAEVLASRWLVVAGMLYALLALAFVLVGMRESAVFAFTGSGRALVSFTHALLVLLPLLALIATAPAVNRAREEGGLELLFTHPIAASSWFVGVSVMRLLALLIPLVVVMGLLAVSGPLLFGQALPLGWLLHCLLVGSAEIVAFCGVGLLVSSLVRSQARALVWALVLWVLAVALLDVALAGLLLQWRLPPQVVVTLAALNPVQAGRLSLLVQADPDLAAYGPVGLYLVSKVGLSVVGVLGWAWPLLLGLGSWALALWRFARGDAI